MPQLHDELAAGELCAVPGPMQLKRLAISRLNSLHHVGDQGPSETVQSAGLAGFNDAVNADGAIP